MTFRRLAGFLAVLAFSVSPGFAQNRNNSPRNAFSIEGSVRDDTGQRALENVRVDLELSTGIPINTTFTRGNGEFEFGGLSNGEYIVAVDMKGYDSARQTVMVSGGSQSGVSIFMNRSVSMQPGSGRASVSAHELSAPPKAHEAYEKGLDLLYSKADPRGAIVQFQRAIKEFATFYEAYAQEGNAYLDLKDLPSAEQAMRKSVDISGGQYPTALFMLAGLLNDTDRHEDAIEFAQKAGASDPTSWRGPFELARAFAGLKQFEQAEKSATQARDLKPDNPQTYLILANIHIQRHEYPELSKDLDSFLKLVPTGPEADQARKTREDLQTALQQADNRPPADRPQSAAAAARPEDSSTHSNGPSASQEERPRPPEPDSSGLPSLPPPNPDN